jgi:hypothetical protein
MPNAVGSSSNEVGQMLVVDAVAWDRRAPCDAANSCPRGLGNRWRTAELEYAHANEATQHNPLLVQKSSGAASGLAGEAAALRDAAAIFRVAP